MIPLHRQAAAPRRWRLSLIVALVCLLVAAVLFWQHRRHVPVGERGLSTELKDWQPYEGAWVSEKDIISNLRNGRGDKLASTAAAPDDLVFSGEIRFDSESDMQWGDAGLIVRATNLAHGTDALNGYYLGLRPVSRELLLGREEYNYVNLAIQPLSEPLELGAWYRLQLRVRGCHLEAIAYSGQGEEIGAATVDDRNCRTLHGAVGLRSYSMLTSWRHLAVRELR